MDPRFKKKKKKSNFSTVSVVPDALREAVKSVRNTTGKTVVSATLVLFLEDGTYTALTHGMIFAELPKILGQLKESLEKQLEPEEKPNG